MDRGMHAAGTRLARIADAQGLIAKADGALSRLLTTAEIAQANARESPAEYVAGHLAAKGAAADALTRLLPAGAVVDPHELEVLDAPSGAPVCAARGRLATLLAGRNIEAPRVSITNEAGVALATAVAWAPAAGGPAATRTCDTEKARVGQTQDTQTPCQLWPCDGRRTTASTPATEAEEDSMDESDMELAGQLREQLEANGVRTAFDAPQDGQDGAGSLAEGPFAQAMAAYRQAKRTGDAEATAAAERHLQDVVRAELADSAEPCSGDGR